MCFVPNERQVALLYVLRFCSSLKREIWLSALLTAHWTVQTCHTVKKLYHKDTIFTV